MSQPRILIIVPAYNEGEALRTLLPRLSRALPNCDILVVDDGSTDGTPDHVPAHCTVISLPFNVGIGGAMQTGYRYAALHDYDIAVQCDGDGQHRPREIRRLVERLAKGDCEFVVGSRFLDPKGKYRQTVPRRTGSFVLGQLIRLFTGLYITDCTSGFRAANREVIGAFAHWYPEDYPEPEVILLLKLAGFRICEVQVQMRQRRTGTTSIPLMKGIFYVLKVIVCILLDMVRDPWPGTAASKARKKHDRKREHGAVRVHRPQPVPDSLGRKPAGPGDPKASPVQA